MLTHSLLLVTSIFAPCFILLHVAPCSFPCALVLWQALSAARAALSRNGALHAAVAEAMAAAAISWSQRTPLQSCHSFEIAELLFFSFFFLPDFCSECSIMDQLQNKSGKNQGADTARDAGWKGLTLGLIGEIWKD